MGWFKVVLGCPQQPANPFVETLCLLWESACPFTRAFVIVALLFLLLLSLWHDILCSYLCIGAKRSYPRLACMMCHRALFLLYLYRGLNKFYGDADISAKLAEDVLNVLMVQ